MAARFDTSAIVEDDAVEAWRAIATLPGGGLADPVWRLRQIRRLPSPLRAPIAEHYRELHAQAGHRSANLALLGASDHFDRHGLQLACSDDAIIRAAKARARDAFIVCQRTDSDTEAYAALSSLAAHHGVIPPALHKGRTLRGAILRMRDEYWWRRALRRERLRRTESYLIGLGQVRRPLSPYVSVFAYGRRAEQRARLKALLTRMVAVSDHGDELSLAAIVERSQANPRLRRNELMVRMAGSEAYARMYGHVAEFLTFTCPSKFHARLFASGAANPKYDNSTPRDAQAWLRRQWARIRSALHRRNVYLYGFRIAEPHHDGTPHWHLLVFCEPAARSTLLAICRKYLLADSPDEPGASEHRFKALSINYSRGTATGYVAKYVAKNIDGTFLESAPSGTDPTQMAARVEAWASTWGIRQFQQVGAPPVGLWRELRRASTCSVPALEDAWSAADRGDWMEFLQALGGPLVRRTEQRITLLRTWSDQPNRYGEPQGLRTIGVEADGISLVTRRKTWRLSSAPKATTTELYGHNHPVGPDQPLAQPQAPPSVPRERPFSPLESCQ